MTVAPAVWVAQEKGEHVAAGGAGADGWVLIMGEPRGRQKLYWLHVFYISTSAMIGTTRGQGDVESRDALVVHGFRVPHEGEF